MEEKIYKYQGTEDTPLLKHVQGLKKQNREGQEGEDKRKNSETEVHNLAQLEIQNILKEFTQQKR